MTRRERLFDLLADRALVGLSSDEQAELDVLLREEPGIDVDSFEKAASSIALSSVPMEAMPARLSERVEMEAMESLPTQIAPSDMRPKDLERTVQVETRGPVASRPQDLAKTAVSPPSIDEVAPPVRPKHLEKTAVLPEPAPFRPKHLERTAPMPQPAQNVLTTTQQSNVVPLAPRRASRVVAITGWIAAAACLALAIGAWKYRPRAPEIATASFSVERDKLLAKAGTTRLEWSSTPDPAGKAASGDVVWNAIEQRGFMRFRGLAKNDPRGWQYQLWIFDKTRDDKYPVDGGVFDVDAASGDVVVPIKARLPVAEPTLFAVTIEKPGGVVVSKRERIVVTAKPAG
jgi:hypothetical protein